MQGRKTKYTWNQFDADIRKITKYASQYGEMIQNIYGIPRGGLPLCVALSHLLDKPIILDGGKIGKNTLVVDDISDTGNTLFKLLKNKQCFGVITLFMRRTSKFKPIMYCRKVENEWIRFPWETRKSSKRDNI